MAKPDESSWDSLVEQADKAADYKYILSKVAVMRRLQKSFFHTKLKAEAQRLLEREVDRLLAEEGIV